jgi:hypothetical protein
MTKTSASKLLIAGQIIPFLIPVVILASGHKELITSAVIGICLAFAAFSKGTDGILTKKTSLRIFNFRKEEGPGDYWFVILLWFGLGLFGVYLAVR